MSASRRTLIVSNRLPVTVRTSGTDVEVVASAGGLATGLRGVHDAGGSVWIGWPGDLSDVAPEVCDQVCVELRDRRILPVTIPGPEATRFCDSFCNGVLWPLFHSLLDRLPVATCEWDTYRRVNARFAAVVCDEYRRGDMIWLHDYHLLLAARLIRDRVPDARIGLFLHVPFPAPDVFRVLPWRRLLLDGLLSCDLVGFHTSRYTAHFLETVTSLAAGDVDGDVIHVEDRQVSARTYPMGIDAAWFARMAVDPDVVRTLAEVKASTARAILLGIDRLDYTKGIPRRLLAFERLLAGHPELRGSVQLIQVAVPSRQAVPAYQQFRQVVEEHVARINGSFRTSEWTPVRYLYRSVSPTELVALYRAADVMLVTPLRDGMNLVAKEFVASRIDEDGVLLLSELAGAAEELPEATIVNPYDIEDVAATMCHVLQMSIDERHQRMRALRRRVQAADVHRWASSFTADLARVPGRQAPVPRRPWRSDRSLPGAESRPAERIRVAAGGQWP